MSGGKTMRSSFGGGGSFEQKDAPVKVGEETEVSIEAVGAKGDGIAKKDGFVIFVPNTRKGDNAKIKITKVLANMAFAELISATPGSESKRRDDASEYAAEASSRENKEEETPVDTENFGEE
jgi:predicted RNA-binding protein with TRAM domain